jgi:hypothetical protein
MKSFLYHGTNFYAARDIIDQNVMSSMTEQRINGDFHLGVSLSRSSIVSMGFGRALFQLDERKLRNTYKKIPFDYFKGQGDCYTYRECEEFVIGNIINVKKYITGIVLVINESDFMWGYGGELRPAIKGLVECFNFHNMLDMVNSNVPKSLLHLIIKEQENKIGYFPKQNDLRSMVINT